MRRDRPPGEDQPPLRIFKHLPMNIYQVMLNTNLSPKQNLNPIDIAKVDVRLSIICTPSRM